MAEPTEQPATPEVVADNAEQQKLYKTWKNRLQRAKKLREDWENEFKVKELENYFLGKQDPSGKIFNHFLATLKAEQPELFYTNPTFMVRPRPDAAGLVPEQKAKKGEGVLQSVAKQDDNLEESGELATAQAYFRMGVLKCVFDPKLEPNPRAGQPIMAKMADDSPVIDPQTQQPTPLTDPKTGQPVIEPDFIVSDETYRWEWVDAKRMLLPDNGPDERKWPWVCEEVSVPLEEAKNDDRFPAHLRERLKSNESIDPDKEKQTATSFSSEDEDDAMFKYCECYDIKHKRWYVYAEGQDFEEFLIDDVLPDGIEDHPYNFLRFNLIQGPRPNPWPLPEVFSWRHVQDEYNIRRSQITEGCGRSARKVFFDEGTFPDEVEATKALRSSVDMEAVRIQSTKNPPITLTDTPMPQDLYRDIMLLQTDWRIITGKTGADMGNPDSNTATEATFTQRASNARTAEKRKIIGRWMRKSGKKMLQLMKGTMTLKMWTSIRGLSAQEVQEYAAQVYGMDPVMLQMMPGIKDILIEKLGQQKWLEVTREDLIFEFDVDVVPGSVRPRTLDLERKEWLEFLTIIGQFPQLLLSRKLLEETATKYETITPALIDELQATAQKMMMASQATAGRSGDNAQGGGPGPDAAANTLTAMVGAVQ
jgi:8-oxo-dGTP pyrophosphatase MutT (NUDIX family)